MLAQLTGIKAAALDLFFPRYCIGCGREGAFLCDSCLGALPWIQPPVCPRCGRPQQEGSFCGDCAGWQADIERVRSPFRFEGAIRKAVHELKYQNLAAIAAPLAGFMARYLEKEPIEADVLVPVPLHPRRFHDRAFNQSALLAGELGKRLGLPVDEACLIRARFNLPQARTRSLEERRANVAGVFACRGDSVRGKRVLLIDDVSTSGATLNACAVALKSGGAKSVSGLTLAREI